MPELEEFPEEPVHTISGPGRPSPRRVGDLYGDPEPAAEAPPPPAVHASPLELLAEDPAPAPGADEIPEWARPHLPPGMRVPRGAEVMFLRFRSSWTPFPTRGVPTAYPEKNRGQDKAQRPIVQVEHLSRVLVLWALTDGEEMMAVKRSRGETGRMVNENAKAMIRACDGKLVDWSGEWAKNQETMVDANVVWHELGAKCQRVVKSMWSKLHNLDEEQLADFLVNGIGVARAVVG